VLWHPLRSSSTCGDVPKQASFTLSPSLLMPFPVTQREKVALSVIALLIVLGLLGMAVL
jgi:hypothetical protein